jgi:hypothetical protein
LVYDIGKPFTFESQKTKDSFQSIQIANLGDQAARDVVVVVRFSGPLRILDHSTSFSSEITNQLTGDQSNDQGIELHIASLVPHERVVIVMMLSGISTDIPTIGVWSATASGSAGSLVESISKSNSEKKDQVATVLAGNAWGFSNTSSFPSKEKDNSGYGRAPRI